MDKVRTLLPAQKEGKGKEKLAQKSPVESKTDVECQTNKARVMTGSQKPQVSKNGTTPSWMEERVCLDKVLLQEEQLKDPACVNALCWIRQGSRPG